MEKDGAYFECLHEAVSAVAKGDHGTGIAACERALAMHSDGHEAQCVLAMISADMGDLGRSIELLEGAHKAAPDCRDYADVLAVMYARAGKLSDSLYYAKLAMALDPHPGLADVIPPSYRNYRTALDNASPSPNYVNASIRFQQHNYNEAEELCLRYLRLNDSDAAAFRLLGRIRAAQGKYDAALSDFHSAVHLDPADATGYLGLGDCLISLGRLDEGRACHEMAVNLAPADPVVRSRALGFFFPGSSGDGQQFAKASQAAMEACFADVEAIDLSDRGAGENTGRIRVGYLSDGFHDGALSSVLSGVFSSHDHKRFEIFAYQQNIHSDLATTRFKANADHWKEIYDIDDDTLAYIVASDGLDILIDLCSYNGEQRLGLLARKPAPIVASWLSWPHGAGLSAIDYVISDAATLKADKALAKKKKCLSVGNGLLAFDADSLNIDFDALGQSPVSGNGFVTFGAVCDLARVTPAVARVFSRVLRAVPGSYLMFGYVDTICPAVQRRVQEMFSHFGLLNRIAFQTPTEERAANLQFYANVDVILDSFPINGVFETCEALRAGVPVVTLAGARRSARMGASLLRAAGKKEWIAESEDDFVKIAASLTSDIKDLAELRKSLSKAVAKSALCDLAAFTAGLEKTYEQMIEDKGLR